MRIERVDPAEPVYGDWLDANERRLLKEADDLSARQRAEAEAQDAEDLAPEAEIALNLPAGWWLLPAAALGVLGYIWLAIGISRLVGWLIALLP